MSPDEQEAESHKYSNLLSMVLPLSSGKTAVFRHNRELYRIVEHPREIEQAMMELCAEGLREPDKGKPKERSASDLLRELGM